MADTITDTNTAGGRRLAVNLMGMDEAFGGTFRGTLEAARISDSLGVDLLIMTDHLALHGASHAQREGFPYPLRVNWYEPVAALSAIAAVTNRARLGTNVLVAPLRPALLLAKQLATLDQISQGRVEVALGVGWQQAEFDAAGMPFEGRFGILEEQIQVCRSLWAGGPSSHDGKRLSFEDLHSFPVPVQGRGLHLSLGLSASPRNVERIVRLADGWAPIPMPADELAAAVTTLRAACLEAGRDPSTLTVTAAVQLLHHDLSAREVGAAHPLEEAVSLWQAGADVVIVHPRSFCDGPGDLEEFLRPLLEARAS